MFLDPTEGYIRGEKNQSSVKIPLARLNRFVFIMLGHKFLPTCHVSRLFPDHLAPAQGIFGFSADRGYYNGVSCVRFRLLLYETHLATT
jgi:hypothetical protein